MERWVGDKLHDILGISDKVIAQFMIGLASKAKSSDDLVDKIRDTGTIDIDGNVMTFAKELWEKVMLCKIYSAEKLVS